MAEILSGSIDLNKIDKTKIKEVVKKDGTKALYYDVQITINNEADQHNQIGNMITAQTKPERDAKTPKVFLANFKRVWTDVVPKLEDNNEPDQSPLPF